jgi:hypothetical protein
MKEGTSQTMDAMINADGSLDAVKQMGIGVAATALNAAFPGAMIKKSVATLADAGQAAQADVDRLLEKRQQGVNLRETELHISERQAAIDRVDLETEERKGALMAMQPRRKAPISTCALSPILRPIPGSWRRPRSTARRPTPRATLPTKR